MTRTGRRSSSRWKRGSAVALGVAALAVPAVTFADAIMVTGTDGADRVRVERDADGFWYTTINGEIVARASSGDTLDIGTGGGDDRAIFDEVEDFEANISVGLDLGTGADRAVGDITSFDRFRADTGPGDDASVLNVRGNSSGLGLDGGDGHDVWSLHNYGDTNRIRVDGDAGDDIVSLQTRGKDNRFRINGGAGDDVAKITVTPESPGNSLRVDLGGGDDTVKSTGAIRGVYDGGPGNDDITHVGGDRVQVTLSGGADDDLIIARGAGGDTLLGGGSNDRMVARGGGRDTVRCGSGRDTVVVDSRDIVSSDCERRVPYIDLNDPRAVSKQP